MANSNWLADKAHELAERVEELEAERETWQPRLDALTDRLQVVENKAAMLALARDTMQQDRDILYNGIQGLADMDSTPGWLKPMLKGIVRQTHAWRTNGDD